MLAIRTILHPTDFSPVSTYAFHLACSFARDHGARLIVLHVQERSPMLYAGGFAAPPPAPEEERGLLRRELDQIRAPGLDLEHRLDQGDPATRIVEIARDDGCDLIVMGTHGRSGLSRLLMGSVAEKVMRKSPCPVLTVKHPFPDAEVQAGSRARAEQMA